MPPESTLVEVKQPFTRKELGHMFIVLRSVQRTLEPEMAIKNHHLVLKILSLYQRMPVDGPVDPM